MLAGNQNIGHLTCMKTKDQQTKFTRKCSGVYTFKSWTIRKASSDYKGHPFENKWIAEDDNANFDAIPTVTDTLAEMKKALA